MKCVKCGANIASTDKFCSECGTAATSLSIESVGRPVPNEKSQSMPEILNLSSGGDHPRHTAQPSSLAPSRFLWPVVAAVAIIAMASVAIWLWMAKHPITAKAQYGLGLKYENGDGVSQDYSQAAFWYRKAAEKGDCEAQVQLSRMYFYGNGVPKNETEAARWFRKAAEQGNEWAETLLATEYQEGRGGLSKDFVQAAFWFGKAAEQGNVIAQRELAFKYSLGRGVPKDAKQAVLWWRKAAQQGDADSQCALAGSYETGDGVQQDKSQAIVWYQKAAAQGNEDAKDSLNQLLASQSAQQPTPAGKFWTKIDGIDGLPAEAYIDTASISCTSGNVRVWEKFVYPRGSSARLSSMNYLKEHGKPYESYSSDQTLIDIDCMNRNYIQRGMGFFDSNDEEIGNSSTTKLSSKWRDAPHLSIAEAIINRACSIKECM